MARRGGVDPHTFPATRGLANRSLPVRVISAFGEQGWCRANYSRRKRGYGPPRLPIRYLPVNKAISTPTDSYQNANRAQPVLEGLYHAGGKCWLRSNAYGFKARRAAITPIRYIGRFFRCRPQLADPYVRHFCGVFSSLPDVKKVTAEAYAGFYPRIDLSRPTYTQVL